MGCISTKEDIKSKNIEFFTWNGQILDAYIVDVYDGDTITAIFKPKNVTEMIKFKVRMLDYDSPEMKPSKKINETKRIILKSKAIDARDYLRGRILNKWVRMECSSWDKYGRLLARIYLSDKCINKEMLDKGYGYPYSGGTKQSF